jgi:diguanylate cyclase (GGDEF)-like protein
MSFADRLYGAIRRSLPRSALVPWWIWAPAVGLVLAMLTLGGFVIDEGRREALAAQQAASDRLLRALERDIGRTISALDLSLHGVMDALMAPAIDRTERTVRQQALFDRAATAEDVGALLVTDAAGDVVEDSTAPVPHHLNLADRDYFIAQRDHSDLGLFISRVYRSRLVPGDLRISVSRRRPSPDGRFVGIVSGQLRLAYFRHLFQALDIGPENELRLVRTDGAVLARWPYRDAEIERDLDAVPGTAPDQPDRDGGQRLTTVRQIAGLPLVLSVSVDTDLVLAEWRQKSVAIGGLIFTLCAAVLALLALFRREMKRRAMAERALAAAADELQHLARTDALTGLPNRRAFDAGLAREWRRAIRLGEPISLLMLDADRFKAFNDRHGHQRGDEVLRTIAACLQRTSRRPGDLPARYGGEEFAVVLPNTDEAGALVMADLIRAAVEALDIRHAESPVGRVTVSVGVGTLSPLIGWDPALLLRVADAALYVAKRQGRNRVAGGVDPAEAAPSPGPDPTFAA